MDYKVFVTTVVYGLCLTVLMLLVMSLSLYITKSLIMGAVLIGCITVLAIIFGFIEKE